MSATQRNSRRLTQMRAVAERLFRDKGYLATSMRDIADEMQLKGGGSLYAHIKGKEDLLWSIANEATDAFFNALEAVCAQPATPYERLRAAMIAHLLVITEHLGAAAVYFDEWRHLSEPRRSQFMARRDAYEKQFQALLEACIASGACRALDTRLATLHLLSAMNAMRHWYKPNGRLSAQQVAESLADMLLHGLCA